MTACDDPIECGHEAALGQWEARWEMLRNQLNYSSRYDAEIQVTMDRIEHELPTSLPVGEKYIPRMRGHINIQLEPERINRLLEVLTSAGAHPSGLGSYDIAADALALAEDIRLMAEPQGWSR